jgi:DNA polymerase V
MTYAIVDIANFYVSSERVFDPRLRRVPVVVLSNNDGCAIARSEEAKALHIKMGEPFFKIRDIIKRHGIEVRSSNYELYADMNRRFNAVIAEHSDIVEIYSIDESFYRLPVLPNGLGDVAAAHRLREAIARTTGLPTRIGLGPTRALSKVANALAKATEKVWGGVVDLHDKELRARLFAEWPVHEVWGVAKALSVRLHPLGVRTAADLAALPPAVARDVGTVVLERLVRELNGIECDDFKPEPEASKATAVTRQFGAPVTDLAELREAMVRRAVRAAEKIRHQALMATTDPTRHLRAVRRACRRPATIRASSPDSPAR